MVHLIQETQALPLLNYVTEKVSKIFTMIAMHLTLLAANQQVSQAQILVQLSMNGLML
jgi:hypothetical protein